MHQGSVLSPLPFVIVMEALSREFRAALPWELLYTHDLVLIAETEDNLIKGLNPLAATPLAVIVNALCRTPCSMYA